MTRMQQESKVIVPTISLLKSESIAFNYEAIQKLNILKSTHAILYHNTSKNQIAIKICKDFIKDSVKFNVIQQHSRYGKSERCYATLNVKYFFESSQIKFPYHANKRNRQSLVIKDDLIIVKLENNEQIQESI